jgi:NTE family protein
MTTALVLSGGGAKGAFEAGVIAALAEEGVTVDVAAGTSAGALNAATVACGIPADDVVELWSTLQSGGVYRVRRDVHRLLRPWHLLRHPDRLIGLGSHSFTEHLLDGIGWTWLLNLAPLRRRLVELLGDDRLPVRDGATLVVAAVDATTGELVRFTNTELASHRSEPSFRTVELTVDHLLASAAIPGVFAPVEIDGSSYWDGGLVANTPLTGALAYEPDDAFVVAAGAIERTAEMPRSLGQVVSQLVDHVMRFGMVKDLDHAHTVNLLADAAPGASKHRHVDLVPIAPDDDPSGIGALLDFDPARARRLVERGRRAGHDAVQRWRAGDTV